MCVDELDRLGRRPDRRRSAPAGPDRHRRAAAVVAPSLTISGCATRPAPGGRRSSSGSSSCTAPRRPSSRSPSGSTAAPGGAVSVDASAVGCGTACTGYVFKAKVSFDPESVAAQRRRSPTRSRPRWEVASEHHRPRPQGHPHPRRRCSSWRASGSSSSRPSGPRWRRPTRRSPSSRPRSTRPAPQLTQLKAVQGSFETEYASVVRLGKAIPSSLDMPSLLVQLDSAAKGTGIKFDRITAGARTRGDRRRPPGRPRHRRRPAATPPPGGAPASTRRRQGGREGRQRRQHRRTRQPQERPARHHDLELDEERRPARRRRRDERRGGRTAGVRRARASTRVPLELDFSGTLLRTSPTSSTG